MPDFTDVVVDLIKQFVILLCDNRDAVEVTAQTGDRMINVTIVADKNDIGKIIGKRGRTISSLRRMMQSVAAVHKKRIGISVLD